MNCSEQEAFDDDSRQRDEERRRMDAHPCPHMEKLTQRMDTNCNASYAWARTPAKGHAVAGAGYKAETPLWLLFKIFSMR